MATTTEELSADEIALYDRQLRLWGIEAQNRMRKANVLLINIRALGNEIAKNLVLAGIGSLTIMDSNIVTEADIASQFFITEENLGKNRAEASLEEVRRLNPRVQVNCDTSSVVSKSSSFFQKFDIVIATELLLSEMISINEYTRAQNIPFYAASLHGLCGIAFVDLIKHSFLINTPPSKHDVKADPATCQRTETYCSLTGSLSTPYGKLLKPRQARKVSPLLPLSHGKTALLFAVLTVALLSWLDTHPHSPASGDLAEFSQIVNVTISKLSLPATVCTATHVQDFISQLEPQDLSGVAAVVGGILGQDVLNALGGRELPIKNWLIFDGRSCEGKIYSIMGDTNGAS